MIATLYFSAASGIPDNAVYIEYRSRYLADSMSTPGQRPSSSSRDLTLVVESESGTPEEYFAQVGLSMGRAKSNTIHIDHPDVDHIHAKVVKRDESFWLRCEGQAKLQVLEPEPGEVEEVELAPGLTIELGGGDNPLPPPAAGHERSQ